MMVKLWSPAVLLAGTSRLVFAHPPIASQYVENLVYLEDSNVWSVCWEDSLILGY